VQFKLFTFTIEDEASRPVGPDRVFPLFEQSRGRDTSGELARHRGKKDAVLMYTREYGSDFSGLVGRFSDQREVSVYNEPKDEVYKRTISDNDYPNVPFICFPRLGCIVCANKSSMTANAAVSRLHAIIAHRAHSFMLFSAFTQPIDLRVAVERFNLFEVDFELFPVNPHTGDLGKALDESRKRDFINTIKGKAASPKGNKLRLNGGFLSAIQELQQSGHAKAGFRATTDDGLEVTVPKQVERHQLKDEPDESGDSMDSADVQIIVNVSQVYPFTQSFVTSMRTIARRLTGK
jgi:hypothetical protein